MVQTSLWQTYQWQGPCIFFQAILTQFWSTYVVLTNLTDKIIIIFVVTGGSNFSLTNISMTGSLHILSGNFDSILIHLCCFNKYYWQNHHYFRCNRWFKLLLNKLINDSILAHSNFSAVTCNSSTLSRFVWFSQLPLSWIQKCKSVGILTKSAKLMTFHRGIQTHR